VCQGENGSEFCSASDILSPFLHVNAASRVQSGIGGCREKQVGLAARFLSSFRRRFGNDHLRTSLLAAAPGLRHDRNGRAFAVSMFVSEKLETKFLHAGLICGTVSARPVLTRNIPARGNQVKVKIPGADPVSSKHLPIMRTRKETALVHFRLFVPRPEGARARVSTAVVQNHTFPITK